MLTDTKIKQAKVTDKPYKIYDSEGLYIEVAPTGSKRWRWRYRWNGKEKLLSFGIYPEVPLKLARDRRAAAKELLVSGVDPSQARKEEKVESGELFCGDGGGVVPPVLCAVVGALQGAGAAQD